MHFRIISRVWCDPVELSLFNGIFDDFGWLLKIHSIGKLWTHVVWTTGQNTTITPTKSKNINKCQNFYNEKDRVKFRFFRKNIDSVNLRDLLIELVVCLWIVHGFLTGYHWTKHFFLKMISELIKFVRRKLYKEKLALIRVALTTFQSRLHCEVSSWSAARNSKDFLLKVEFHQIFRKNTF